MKVNSQLESAQLEILSADPTNLPRGRTWFDKVLGKARIFDGSAIRSLAFETASSVGVFDAGIGTIAKAINWSNGVSQRVRLTGPTAITFIFASGQSGIDGQEYTLIVESNVSTPFPFVFNLGSQDGLGNPVMPPCLNYGEVRVFKFLYRSGFPSPITNPTLISEPSSSVYGAGATTATCCDLIEVPGESSPLLLAMTTGTTKQQNVYQFRRFYGKAQWVQTVNQTFGSNTTWACRTSPSRMYLAVAHNATPYVYVMPTNTFYASPAVILSDWAPATPPAGQTTSVDWHPTERAFAVSHTTTPFMSVYPWSSTGVAVKYANPVTLPAGNGLSIAWNPLGDYIALAHTTTPFISVYAFDLINGLGGKSADPSVLPTAQTTAGAARSIAWSPGGDWIVAGAGTSPFLWSCPFNRSTGTFGTPQSPPTGSVIPAGEVRSVAFSKDGAYVFIGGTGSANIFPFDNVNGINYSAPLNTSFAAQTYMDAVWSNVSNQLFTVTTASSPGSPISHSVPYVNRPWSRSGIA